MNRLCIQDGARIIGPENFTHGDQVHIGAGTEIQAEGGVTIGSNVVISFNCVFWSINHDYNGELLPYDYNRIRRPIVINDNVWIGRNVILNGGIRIGEGAVVGLGSVVTKDVPPLAIVGGNPAKIINFRPLDKYLRLRDEGKRLGAKGQHCMACGPEAHARHYLSNMALKIKKPFWKKILKPLILRIKLEKIKRANLQF